MSGYVDWIGAQADESDPAKSPLNVPEADEQPLGDPSPNSSWQGMPVHNFPAGLVAPDEARLQDDPLDRDPDLWQYRSRTVALLRRYLRFSLETGRLPSIVGREFFRAKITSYTATTFEDRVIFVRDVEKSLERLEYWDQQLIARIIFQEHGQEQAARVLHCNRKTVQRRLPQVLDLLSEDFLRVGLLVALPSSARFSQ
jgi:phage-related protein